MKLMHILFRVMAQGLKKEAIDLTEQDVLRFFHNQKNANETLPVFIGFGIDNDLEVNHNDWDADSLITGFHVWRTINNFDK